MEIKDTEQICLDNVKTRGAEDVEWFNRKELDNKWVAMEDLIPFLSDCIACKNGREMDDLTMFIQDYLKSEVKSK